MLSYPRPLELDLAGCVLQPDRAPVGLVLVDQDTPFKYPRAQRLSSA